MPAQAVPVPPAAVPTAAAAPLGRRSFLAAGVAGASALAWPARSYARIRGANDRLGVAVVGAGGMGSGHLRTLHGQLSSENLRPVAVADCWKTRAEAGAATLGGPAGEPYAGQVAAHADYRAVLDDPAVDYVTIATPEHRHAEILTATLRAGRAAYCEKPLTHTPAEAVAAWDLQKETNLPVQVGVQSTSNDCYRTAAEAIAGGLLGRVVQAQICYVRRYGEQGLFREPSVTGDEPKPADLDWSAWLGPAPQIGWNPHHYHEWRCYGRYSGGIATDLFIHRLTRILIACGLSFPTRVSGHGGIRQWDDGRTLPDNFEMLAEFPAGPACPDGMSVYTLGTMSNRVPVDHLIRGYRATMEFHGGNNHSHKGWVARDKDGRTLAEHAATGGEDIGLHHANLHAHLRDRSVPLNCPIELGVAGLVTCALANDSWREGKMRGWNAATRTAADPAPADLPGATAADGDAA